MMNYKYSKRIISYISVRLREHPLLDTEKEKENVGYEVLCWVASDVTYSYI